MTGKDGSIARWMKKRKITTIPHYVISPFVQYHKWIRKTYRALSLSVLIRKPEFPVVCDYDNAVVQMCWPTESECRAQREKNLQEDNVSSADNAFFAKFLRPKCKTEVWNEGPCEEFHFRLSAHGWVCNRTYSNLFTLCDDRKIFKRLAQLRVYVLMKRFRLSRDLCHYLALFAMERVDVHLVPETEEEDN